LHNLRHLFLGSILPKIRFFALDFFDASVRIAAIANNRLSLKLTHTHLNFVKTDYSTQKSEINNIWIFFI